MKDTAPKEQGILLIAAVFGFIGGAVAYVVYNFGLGGAGLVALIVALVVAIALWFGWRDPKAHPKGNDVAPAKPLATSAGGHDKPEPQTQTQAPAASEAETPVTAQAQPMDTAKSDAKPTDQPLVTETPVQAYDVTSQPEKSGSNTSAGTVRPSTRLAGQEELATRKGTWKYQGDATVVQAMPMADTTLEAHPEAKGNSEVDAVPDAATGPQEQPKMMSAPREGGPDNLKQIKGVGPKLEDSLHEMGIYHFDQIAGWSAAEVAYMDANLRGFRGRVSRNDWIAQAKVLAAGGETDF